MNQPSFPQAHKIRVKEGGLLWTVISYHLQIVSWPRVGRKTVRKVDTRNGKHKCAWKVT